jgi:hypothetical protein
LLLGRQFLHKLGRLFCDGFKLLPIERHRLGKSFVNGALLKHFGLGHLCLLSCRRNRLLRRGWGLCGGEIATPTNQRGG